jgi:hypothetical protein
MNKSMGIGPRILHLAQILGETNESRDFQPRIMHLAQILGEMWTEGVLARGAVT